MKIILTNNLRLSGIPSDFRQILMETLEFPNPKWLENARMGRWNKGTPKLLKFYDKIRGNGLWIPRGFTRRLILLCRKNSIDYTMEDKRRILDSVDFTFKGSLREFQTEAVDRMLAKDFGTLNAPTGSGKTVMALYMIAMRKQPTLIVVHTKDLAFQWMDRAHEFLDVPVEEIGFIGGGKKKTGEKITVALVQSLYKCAEEISPGIGFIIVDECHRCPSRTFTEAVTCFDSRYMLGLSATPWRRDNLSKLIFWHLGDVHHEVDKEKLVENGDVLPVEVIVRHTEFEPYYDPVNDYSRMLSELTSDDGRNRLIAADIAEVVQNNTKGTCLVLSDRKKHCEVLQSLLKFKHGTPADLLTGDLSTAERKEVLVRLNSGKVRVLIATGQLIGEGFDSGNLSPLFLATPIRFSGRVIQYLGRVLRPAPGKDKAVVYDYVDSRVDVLMAAARARQKVYTGERSKF